jgi:NAD(P)-dependent dehydrogenase (short-subunit alcohol dehydrogenase family)
MTNLNLAGKTVFVSGSSRGIGAATVQLFAAAGARVVINYRDKAARAEKIAEAIRAGGGTALTVQADLTDYDSVAAARDLIEPVGSLDFLVMNASGGMEAGKGEDYALRLNRDAQVNLLETMVEIMGEGGRIVFITSHQAHFVHTFESLPEYMPVALSKRAGEDALRERIPALAEKVSDLWWFRET